MSERKEREIWFGYVCNVLRAYPQRKAALDELHSMNVTPGYGASGGGGSGDVKRTTELIAVRELPGNQMRELEAVQAALEFFRRRGYREMGRLAEMVYFKRSHTLTGAANKLHLSMSTARKWNYFLKLKVGEGLGLVEDAEEIFRARR